jgi:parallel beta-helix repeat protein
MIKKNTLLNKTLVVVILFLFVLMNINISISGISLKQSYKSNSYTPHDPIYIHGNYEFTSENGVTGGTGWVNDPFIIEGWEINASSDHGITIEDTNKCFEIRNCYIHSGGSSKDGIVFYHVINGIINSSIISNNKYGIIFRDYDFYIGEDSSYNKIMNNTIKNNKKDGIHFEHTLSDYHSYNLIFLNEISNNNQHGIYMIMSEYNQIFSNNFISNTKMGVNLTMCMGGGAYNSVYHNNFIDNSEEDAQASAWWTIYNDWDNGYPSGGNYWNDYDGSDEYSGPYQNISGSDGIGDTPYELHYDKWYYPYDVDYDFYPLMNPWGGNIRPFADFNWTPPVPNPGEKVFFNASVSIDYDGFITLYRWDWDDDGIYDENHSIPLANYTFEENGYYPVTLCVKDNESDNGSITKTIRIGNYPPVAIDDFYEVNDNSEENVLEVLENDYDLDGDILTIESVTDPLNGSVVNHGDYITYTPEPDFWGYDEFEYTINDGYNGTSSASVFITVIDFNRRPSMPTIDGPPTGRSGEDYCIIIHSTDPDGDELFYLIDWGDGTTSGWLGPFPECEPIKVCHKFKKGIYSIRAMTKDIYDDESDWSDPLEITIPRSRIFLNSHLNWILDFFPIIVRILSKIIVR